jgi:hypothetical protein
MLTIVSGRKPIGTRASIAFAALLALPAFAGEPLALRISPSVSLEPATVAVDVIAERHSQNRALLVCLESPEYYRSSLVQLDGDAAPRVTTMRFSGLPAGSYEVRTILFGDAEKPRASVTRNVEVLARSGR